MEFFNAAVDVMKTVVVALGGGLGVWGAVNLLEGYGGEVSGDEAARRGRRCRPHRPDSGSPALRPVRLICYSTH